MFDWSSRQIVVTGGAGFLGKTVVTECERRNARSIFVPRSREYDLRDQTEVRRLFDHVKPDIVIHLAATVGGIGGNQHNPGVYFYDNAIMGLNIIEQARLSNTMKTVIIGTVCAYPKNTPVPFKESALWDGYPEETNAPYGLAKKMLLVQAQAYREQYRLNVVYLQPANLYGPGDNFDPETSHVIPALIKKFVHAKRNGEPAVTIWGTGKPTREFMHADDAARAICLATESYEDREPVNLGSGEEISIEELAAVIAEIVGFHGQVEYDTTKPDGQPRRLLDTSRAKQKFGFEATIPLRVGLEQTIEWFLAQGTP